MVFNALKDWLLCDLLGAWYSMYWRVGCFVTYRSVTNNLFNAWSSMHFYSFLISLLSPPHTSIALPYYLQEHPLPAIRTETESTHYAGSINPLTKLDAQSSVSIQNMNAYHRS
jgi:hypothetical protein